MIRLQLGKWLPRGSVPGGLFGQRQALARDPLLQFGVLRRIGNVDPTRDYPNGRRKRALMRRTIDAPRQTGNHGQPLPRQRIGEIARQLHRRRAGVARADHCHAGLCCQRKIAPPGQDGRSTVDFGEQGRIVRLVMEQILRPSVPHRLHFAFHALDRHSALLAPTPHSEIGQRLQHLCRSPEARKQLGITDRPDMRRTQQPDARKRLLLRQSEHRPVHYFFDPTFGSVPSARRFRLAR